MRPSATASGRSCPDRPENADASPASQGSASNPTPCTSGGMKAIRRATRAARLCDAREAASSPRATRPSAMVAHATSRPRIRELTKIAGTGGSLNRRHWSRIDCHSSAVERVADATLADRELDQPDDRQPAEERPSREQECDARPRAGEAARRSGRAICDRGDRAPSFATIGMPPAQRQTIQPTNPNSPVITAQTAACGKRIGPPGCLDDLKRRACAAAQEPAERPARPARTQTRARPPGPTMVAPKARSASSRPGTCRRPSTARRLPTRARAVRPPRP